jgi:hypothetical protein
VLYGNSSSHLLVIVHSTYVHSWGAINVCLIILFFVLSVIWIVLMSKSISDCSRSSSRINTNKILIYSWWWSFWSCQAGPRHLLASLVCLRWRPIIYEFLNYSSSILETRGQWQFLKQWLTLPCRVNVLRFGIVGEGRMVIFASLMSLYFQWVFPHLFSL